MALSVRLPQRGTPRPNSFIANFAEQAAHAGLSRLAAELRGRTVLTEDDLPEIEKRIAAGHAALDRLSIDLEYSRPAFLIDGADNVAMSRRAAEAEQATEDAHAAAVAEAGEALS